MREPENTRERERRAREKYYDREGLSHDFGRPKHLRRAAEMDSPDYNSIEYQARYDIWREQAMLPGMIEPADIYAPGFGPEVVQREPMDDAPEWDLSGGNMTSSERPEWTLESETDEEFNQSHVSGTDVKVDAEGNVEDIEDLDVFLDWQIANAEEVQRIRDLVKLIFRLRHENAGFISQDTEEGMHLLALGGEARLEAYRAAYGEYQKKALRGGFLIGFREALADTGDVAAAFLIAAPLGPHGLAAAAAYLQFEERQSFQQLNEPVLAEQRALFLQLLFQAEGNPVRTAALIDAFESGDSAGRHAGFIAFVLAEMAAGGGASSLLRGGIRGGLGLRRILRKMSPAARRRLKEVRKQRRQQRKQRDKRRSREWQLPDAVLKRIPKEWGSPKPNRKKIGMRWIDPENQNNSVRIDKGDPKSMMPSQRVDHVIVNHNGRVIGRDGKPLTVSITDDPIRAHIPLSEYVSWATWYSP